MPLWFRRCFKLKLLAVWAFLIWERMGVAREMEKIPKAQDNNFTLSSSNELGLEISFAQLACLCLAENDRRLAPYDLRLIRLILAPSIMRLVLRFLPKPALGAT